MRRQEDPSRLPSSPLARQMENDLSSSLPRELHRLTIAKMHFERGDHTFEPTALMNDLSPVGKSDSIWQARSRILGLAANVIRHILIDYARVDLLKSGKMDGCMSRSSKIRSRRQPV
jgi:hypothetical protein